MEQLIRNLFLMLSKSKSLTTLSKRYGPRFGAQRFVVGMNIEESVEEIRALNDSGLAVTLDHLGEFVRDEKEMVERTAEVIHCIETIFQEQLNAEISIKLTSLGLDQSIEVTLENMRKILNVASEKEVTITIDMEDYSRVDKTLHIFEQLNKEYNCVGTVLQAYLYRTCDDLNKLAPESPYLRLVKGAYLESSEVAFPSKSDVDENYRNLIKLNLIYGNYTAIATHDLEVIEFVQQLVETHGIPRSQFEFQMLYGIRYDLQRKLQKEGFKVRVYVPYGKDWFGYNMRRLAERPANLWFVLKNIFKK